MNDWPAVRRAGDRGLLVELGDNAAVHALAAEARLRWGAALTDAVPGHTTLLLLWRERPTDVSRLTAEIRSLEFNPATYVPPRRVTIPVRYDGPDLQEVANATGLSPEGVAELHSTPDYRAAFIGFSPGFAYLIGGDQRLNVPRREQPRARVEAGAVAIAAGYSAVYPSAGPGGWQLIGHAGVRMFDASQEPAALIEPGTIVRFEAVSG